MFSRNLTIKFCFKFDKFLLDDWIINSLNSDNNIIGLIHSSTKLTIILLPIWSSILIISLISFPDIISIL